MNNDQLQMLLIVVGILVAAFIYFYPMVRILHRMGYSGWWIALYSLIPFGLIIGLWILAFKKWPGILAECPLPPKAAS
jgi:hypothetical protein